MTHLLSHITSLYFSDVVYMSGLTLRNHGKGRQTCKDILYVDEEQLPTSLALDWILELERQDSKGLYSGDGSDEYAEWPVIDSIISAMLILQA